MLTPWEVGLIRQIDSAVLPILNNKKEQQEPENVVEATDASGVKGLMGLLKAKAHAVFAKEPAPQSSAMPTA